MPETQPFIYLDHAASTPMRPEAAAAMQAVLEQPDLHANPFSNHAPGKAARAKLDELRARVAAHFACAPEDVVFNSGGSEGDTQALIGTAWLLDRPIHLAISAIEHEAVVEAAKRLEHLGHRASAVPVNRYGVIELQALEELMRDNRPDLVSIMAVNNETGVVQPCREAAALCREHGVIFHCDAVRAAGHGLGELLRDPNINLLNCTGHKFGGPRGAGVLVQRGVRLPQLVCGGWQEGGSRAGTENLAGNAGLVTALELATDAENERVEALRRQMDQELVDRFPFCEIHGKRAQRATHVTSVSFAPKSGYKLQAALDEAGIAVGTGSACHDDGSVSISRVLKAMGVEELLARGTLRISLGWNSSWDEIDDALTALTELIHGVHGEELNCEI